ncbi:hypothetical protein OIV83_006199 [Microbotryomycetes sp. JL201]|nr:hypothetical protein OIV83_006199 [Microbotryomycetes sp. JL201]
MEMRRLSTIMIHRVDGAACITWSSWSSLFVAARGLNIGNVWLPAVTFSAVEGLYTATALTAVETHNFASSKIDMGSPMLSLYSLATGTTIIACWGVWSEGDDWWKYLIFAIGVLSNITTVVLVCVSYRLHVLLLRESGTDAPKKKKKKHRWHRHSKADAEESD